MQAQSLSSKATPPSPPPASPHPTSGEPSADAPDGLAHDVCNLLGALQLYTDLLAAPGVLRP